MTRKPTVLIFRERLLPISETFVRAQASALQRYRPVFTGFYREENSLPLPSEAVHTLGRGYHRLGRARVRLFHRTAVAPVFWRQLAQAQPMLIHAHFAPDGVAALTLARQLTVPLIVTLHGFDVTVRRDFRKDYRELWEEADHFVCVSEFIRDKAIEAGFPARKLSVHHIGIDTDAFSRSASASSFDPHKIVFVGRLVEKKGCTYLLQALQEVQRRIPGSHAVIIGDGPLFAPLQQQALSLGVQCEFLGRQNSAAIREQMESASVVCFPSVTAANGDSEGLGMVLLEAGALGVPVVATSHGGIVDAVVDGTSGLLVPEGDVAALSAALQHVLSDAEFRTRTAISSMEHVREHFDLQAQTALLEEVYDRVRFREARR